MFDIEVIVHLIEGAFAILWTVLMAVLGWNWNKLDKRVDFVEGKFDKSINDVENKADAIAILSGGLSRDVDDLKKSVTKIEVRHEDTRDNITDFRNKASDIFVAKDEYFRNQAKTDKILAELPKQLAAENRQLLADLGLIKK